MTRLFLVYYYGMLALLAWGIFDSLMERHDKYKLAKRIVILPLWPLALLFKRGRKLLLLGG